MYQNSGWTLLSTNATLEVDHGFTMENGYLSNTGTGLARIAGGNVKIDGGLVMPHLQVAKNSTAMVP